MESEYNRRIFCQERANAALTRLHGVITHKDQAVPLRLYGAKFRQSDLTVIPAEDLPPGTPEWMRTQLGWAERIGETAAKKRAQIIIHAKMQ